VIVRLVVTENGPLVETEICQTVPSGTAQVAEIEMVYLVETLVLSEIERLLSSVIETEAAKTVGIAPSAENGTELVVWIEVVVMPLLMIVVTSLTHTPGIMITPEGGTIQTAQKL